MIREFQIATPITYLQTNLVITGLLSYCGAPFITESIGGSVARAIAAKVSIIAFIHRSYTADIGDWPISIDPKNTVMIAEMLQVT